MIKKEKGRAHIGTSGWQYSHWRGNFYPDDLVQKDWLKFYSKHFDTVEVNSSFYRQTKASTFEKWKSEAGENFVFSIKGNRYITHIKRLKDCEEPLKIFFENVKVLWQTPPSEESTSATLGVFAASHKPQITSHVILWQTPPFSKKNVDRLRSFLDLLAKTASQFRHAFEFRHQSWVDKEVYISVIQSTLTATVVFQDWRDWPRTADYSDLIGLHGLKKLPFIYLRFHGREQLYTSGYSEEELAQCAGKVRKWIKAGLDVYAYFNNDALGYAVENAMKLKKLI